MNNVEPYRLFFSFDSAKAVNRRIWHTPRMAAAQIAMAAVLVLALVLSLMGLLSTLAFALVLIVFVVLNLTLRNSVVRTLNNERRASTDDSASAAA